MFRSFLLSILLITILATSIYPNYNSKSEIQWEQNIWIDCLTKEDIKPQKCNENEQNWQECYSITQNGICLKQTIDILQSGSITLKISFYENIGSKVQIDINNVISDYTLTTNYVKIIQNLSNTKVDIQVKKIDQQNDLKLNGLYITTDCDYNCNICNEDNTCKECLTGYWEYNYICIPDSCENQISTISQSSHKQSFSLIEQDTNNYQITSQFNIFLNNCLIPKIYLTKSLEDNSIVYVFDESQIQIDIQNNTQINYYLTPQQYQQYCSNIETNDSFYYQCFIGLSITVNQLPQYLLLLLGQIQVMKQTSAISDSFQIFDMPIGSDTAIIGPVIIISDTTNTQIDNNNQLIQTTQTIADPNYQNYTVNFLDGQIEQNQTIIPLNLQDQNQEGSTIQYTLSYNNTEFNPDINYTVTVGSTLQQQNGRRMLSTRNIVAKLKMQNQISYSSGQIQQSDITLISSSNQQKTNLKGSLLVPIFLAVIIFAFISTIGTYFLVEKVFKKKNMLPQQTPAPILSQQPNVEEIQDGNVIKTENAQQQNK